MLEDRDWEIRQGDSLELLRGMPDQCVQCCVCSPPYWGLRSYLPEGHADKALEMGSEQSPDEYVARMVEVFREVRRVLRDDGTLWLNMGDSYNGSGGAGGDYAPGGLKDGQPKYPGRHIGSLKPKDLVGIPWMVAFALRSDGWYLRSDCIWCLSGGTWLYTRTQKGDMPMMLKDATRLDPSTVKLWNGEKWTQVSGWSRSEQQGDALEITLRSGERISCTPTHKFPTTKGLLSAAELSIGDCLITTTIPEPKQPRDSEHIGIDTAWLAGLYIAEGSRSEDTIQIAGHAKEDARWERVKKIAESYSGAATRTVDGNKMDIRVYGKILNALIDQFVSGKTAKNKCLNPVCWRYSNQFLRSLLDGYLSGDGCWDANNNRWRLGFTRNYNLERDLRTLAARLGFRMTLNLSSVPYNGDRRPTFRGEIRFDQSGHHNEKSMTEIVKIQKAKCRYVYDVGVADEPHLFALASGVLTHNSKPNPMPESVTDRPTKAHEYLFLLSKREHYYYDAEAIADDAINAGKTVVLGDKSLSRSQLTGFGKEPWGNSAKDSITVAPKRNKRTVWTIATHPFPEAHFATFPPALVEPCILTGSSPQACPVCGAPWKRVTEKHLEPTRKATKTFVVDERDAGADKNDQGSNRQKDGHKPGWIRADITLGFQPTCSCPGNDGSGKSIVLDPFSGSGTTIMVALRHGRKGLGLELNSEYVEMSKRRIIADSPLFNGLEARDENLHRRPDHSSNVCAERDQRGQGPQCWD